jgi:hypothetical protein
MVWGLLLKVLQAFRIWLKSEKEEQFEWNTYTRFKLSWLMFIAVQENALYEICAKQMTDILGIVLSRKS